MPGFLQLNLGGCGHLTPSVPTSPRPRLPQGRHWLLGGPGREELNLPGGLKSSCRNEKIYDSLSPAPQEESSAFPIPLPNPPAGMGMALAPETEMVGMLQPPAWLQEVSERLEQGCPPTPNPPSYCCQGECMNRIIQRLVLLPFKLQQILTLEPWHGSLPD